MKEIFVTKAYLPPMEEYVAKLSRIWDTHIMTNMGPLHKEFEQKLTQYLGVPGCLAFTNGHLSLETAIQALGVSGEVITTPYTFASTTHAIVRNNLTPVFCDIREDNYTLDADKIESLITEKTAAIVPVHVYGQICDVDKIQKIADKYGLRVVYDAAHAFGEKVGGVGVGNFGDASIFSFHATKSFNSVEGGAITSGSMDLMIRAYQLKNFGIMGEDNVAAVGSNAKMSEFHAAMGLCNLDHFDEILEGRKHVVERYRSNLGGVSGLKLLAPQENVTENYAYFPVLFDDAVFGKSRETAYSQLAQKGIHARRYFYPLTKDFACYHGQFAAQKTPVAEYVTNHILTLPLYDSLADEDVDRICDTLLKRG